VLNARSVFVLHSFARMEPVYCMDDDGQVVVAMVRLSRRTLDGWNSAILKITWTKLATTSTCDGDLPTTVMTLFWGGPFRHHFFPVQFLRRCRWNLHDATNWSFGTTRLTNRRNALLGWKDLRYTVLFYVRFVQSCTTIKPNDVFPQLK